MDMHSFISRSFLYCEILQTASIQPEVARVGCRVPVSINGNGKIIFSSVIVVFKVLRARMLGVLCSGM